MDTTIINSLYEWFINCPILVNDRLLNIDSLGAENEYSIETQPAKKVVRTYVDGSTKCRYQFIFASREYFGDAEINLKNLKFYEDLENWIEEQNTNEKFPVMDNSCTPQKINVLSSGYVFNNQQNSARYQIQCELIYIQQGGN